MDFRFLRYLVCYTCRTEDVAHDLNEQLITIIYCISRHDDGVKQLNALNAIDLIEAFQSLEKGGALGTKCWMILALLLTPEQIKNDSKRVNNIIDVLIKIVHPKSVTWSLCIGGIHVSELFAVLAKIFNDDHTLDYILEKTKLSLHHSSNFEFFINECIVDHSGMGDENVQGLAARTALVNILWSISFQEKYKQKLKEGTTDFKQLIQDYAIGTKEKIASNQYITKYVENIQKAAEGLLFNIDELIHPLTVQIDQPLTVEDKKQKPIIMISYSHENTEFCKQLYNEILKRGYHNIWIDFKSSKSDDLWEKIDNGMNQADVIICLITDEYCNSKSCRLEATYALEKLHPSKLIIPIFLEEHQLPEWLGKLILKIYIY